MENSQIITISLLTITTIISFIVSYRQFKQKGIPINNAYFYVSKKERAEKDFSPHYKQSSVVFFLIGLIFLLDTLNTIFSFSWYFTASIALAVISVVFAIGSSIYIIKKYRF